MFKIQTNQVKFTNESYLKESFLMQKVLPRYVGKICVSRFEETCLKKIFGNDLKMKWLFANELVTYKLIREKWLAGKKNLLFKNLYYVNFLKLLRLFR